MWTQLQCISRNESELPKFKVPLHTGKTLRQYHFRSISSYRLTEHRWHTDDSKTTLSVFIVLMNMKHPEILKQFYPADMVRIFTDHSPRTIDSPYFHLRRSQNCLLGIKTFLMTQCKGHDIPMGTYYCLCIVLTL